jgi:hypothetical protein
MGLILQGIGKGSMFGHGRFLGVHKPWGSASGKANDPFINDRTLIRLSRHTNAEIRNPAVQTLAKRIEAGQVHWQRLITLLDHPETSVKVAAVTSLMKISKEIEVRIGHLEHDLRWINILYSFQGALAAEGRNDYGIEYALERNGRRCEREKRKLVTTLQQMTDSSLHYA